MTDTFVMAILPYAVMVGIAVSATASIALVVSTFLKTQRLDARILPRLAEISSSIERNADRLDAQLNVSSSRPMPTQAQEAVSHLYEIAQDLKGNASEVHRLLDRIGIEGRLTPGGADRGRIVDLGKALSQAESNLAAVVKKIEIQKSESSAMRSARALNEG